MLSRWSKTMSKLYGSHKIAEISSVSHSLTWRTFSNAAAEEAEAESPFSDESTAKIYSKKPQVNLNKMFWSKPCSLALHPDSPLRSEDPQYEGLKRLFLTMMLFYSKQSRSIRGANVIYRRVLSQIDKPAIYDVFSLEKTFRTTFSILVLHMWLCLRRLREDGKEGVELGQYLYEIYNHDLELRVSRAGVNLLLSKWMKDLERIFYGNIVALDAAVLPEAKQDELQDAMSRYIRREYSCMSLTDREAIFSGNFMFTPLDSKTAGGALKERNA
ncbi:hypothetical protein Leryth_008375 [Lithospermum erythrorhizon]|nr:hypothetical protein Leryth_008375 [Lithospermum erythrorhizon]